MHNFARSLLLEVDGKEFWFRRKKKKAADGQPVGLFPFLKNKTTCKGSEGGLPAWNELHGGASGREGVFITGRFSFFFFCPVQGPNTKKGDLSINQQGAEYGRAGAWRAGCHVPMGLMVGLV